MRKKPKAKKEKRYPTITHKSKSGYFKVIKSENGIRWSVEGLNFEIMAGCENMHNRKDMEDNAKIVAKAIMSYFRKQKLRK